VSGFDRIRDPRETPATGPHAGRRALFSAPVPRGPHLRCTWCATPTALGPRTLAHVGLSGFVLVPWRGAPLHGVCPACRHRTWLEVHLS
jgi:hypothetical protein